MTRFEYIGNNMEVIKEGIMLGVISTCVLNHFRIYTQYLNYIALGLPICKAVFIIAEDNKLSEILIHKIKREMETEL
jgi:putative cell wall-binding protein